MYRRERVGSIPTLATIFLIIRPLEPEQSGFWGSKTRHMKNLVAILVIILVMSSCTDNVRARHWGGTETLALNPNEVVLNVTWKDNDMWICTKDTTSGVVYFREKSSWGMMEGAVVFK